MNILTESTFLLTDTIVFTGDVFILLIATNSACGWHAKSCTCFKYLLESYSGTLCWNGPVLSTFDRFVSSKGYNLGSL